MKIHGSFQRAAMFAASAIYPWFAAPSPYIVTAILGYFLYLRANARPTPTGIWAPTIPLPP